MGLNEHPGDYYIHCSGTINGYKTMTEPVDATAKPLMEIKYFSNLHAI